MKGLCIKIVQKPFPSVINYNQGQHSSLLLHGMVNLKKKHKISPLLIIVPAYNEEKNIEYVMEDISRHCSRYDYLIINDGSTDRTLSFCLEKGYNVLDLPINLGLAGRFQAGVRYALKNGYDYVVQFDADGQHRAEYIQPMYECAKEKNCDIVIASRYISGRRGTTLREIGSRLISLCIFLTTGKHIKDPTSGMRLYSRSVMKKIVTQMNYDPEPDTLAALIKSGASVREIPAVMDERLSGASYLNVTNSIKYMFYTCTSILIVHWLR